MKEGVPILLGVILFSCFCRWPVVLPQWFAGRQGRLPAGDVDDARIPESGTQGYAVFHLGGGLRLRDGLEGTLWIENLGDVKYKTHGSGITFPGINVMLGCRYAF